MSEDLQDLSKPNTGYWEPSHPVEVAFPSTHTCLQHAPQPSKLHFSGSQTGAVTVCYLQRNQKKKYPNFEPFPAIPLCTFSWHSIRDQAQVAALLTESPSM